MQLIARRHCLPLLLAIGLAGCGFRLAGSIELPPELAVIQLETSGFDRREREALQDRLRAAGSRLVENPGPGIHRLSVRLQRTDDRRLVTGASSGSNVVRLERSLVFSLRDAAGEITVADTTLVQQKDFRVDDDNLLASTADRDNALADLERALFDQLIRRLARI
ncbi:MAG: hypothetical protein QNJ85_05585 [Gammaproteobacteria bacterium]|nr:hypothetical protein [Gammaproteobacteria bacterium]